MTEKNKNILTGMALGVGICIGLAYISHKKGQRQGLTATSPCPGKDSFLSKGNIPKANLLTKDTPGVYLGESFKTSDRYVGKPLSRDGHVLVLGQTGSGKTASIVNPTMETAGSGFNIYLDVKGELAERYAALYGANPKKKLLVFNPYDSGQSNCRYDPFSSMRREPELLSDHALQLAKALIPEHTNDHNLVWTETAIAFVTGVIIDSFKAGLSFVETMERINSESISKLAAGIIEHGDPTAKLFISKFKAMDSKVIAGIGMELVNNLSSFTASKAFREAFSPSSGEESQEKKELLDWHDLNEGEPFDVILVLPEDKLNVLAPIFRTMVTQLVTSLACRGRRTYNSKELPPVLVVLDEMTQLGRISVLEHALATLRCRGVTMVLLTQDLSALEAIYGNTSTRSIMGNCEYKVILGSADAESQNHLAQLVGTIPVRREGTSKSVSFALGASLTTSRNYSENRENAIQPHAFHTLRNIVLYTPDGTFYIKKHPVFGADYVFGKPKEAQSWMSTDQNRLTNSPLGSKRSVVIGRTGEKQWPERKEDRIAAALSLAIWLWWYSQNCCNRTFMRTALRTKSSKRSLCT